MSRVWAVMRKKMEKSTGVWKKGSWDHLIEFTSLSDLVGQLKRVGASQISKLGIVAHGNQPGLVLLDRDLTPESAPSFNAEFSALSQYMTDYGRLIFFSCKAGSGEPGTNLLNILSGSFLRKRHVIGFAVFGYIAPDGDANTAGEVLADLSPLNQTPNLVQADQTGDKHLTEHSWHSKWSLNGQIIRRPFNDQGAPTTFSRTTYGVKASEKAIRSNRAGVDYVAIDKDRAGSAALRGVVDALGVSVSFRPQQLKFVTRHELDHLARTRHHEGVVVKWNQQMVLNKCANPGCPGHSESWHFCTDFVRAIPNGPLVWP